MIDFPEITQASSPLPRYKCHKEVYAVKLAAIEFHEEQVKYALEPAEGQGFAPFYVEKGWGERCKATDDDAGYYVVYSDGYKSWFPTRALEEVTLPPQGYRSE